MTPGRLREVEALFHGVLEGNEAALDACADDEIRDVWLTFMVNWLSTAARGYAASVPRSR